MDYGRTNLENLTPGENPNLDDQWAYAPARDNAAIGSKVISSPEDLGMPMPQSQTKYGEIVPTTPTVPTAQPGLGGDVSVATLQPVYDKTAIRINGDRLDKKAINEIEKLEDQLNQDENLGRFYDDVRGLEIVNRGSSDVEGKAA